MLSLTLRIVDNQKWDDSRGQATVCNMRQWLARGHVETTRDGRSEEMKGIRRQVRW